MELLEIEKELAGPEREEALRKHDAQLVALERRLEEAMKAGLSPDEFAKCEPLGEAITVARKLLRLQVRKTEMAVS